MARAESTVGPPSKWLLLVEGRAFYELLSGYASYPILRQGPRGDGHPVLALPGFLASDISTRPLRCFLQQMGYISHRWKMGRNLGPRNRLEDRLMERVDNLYQRFDRKVSLVGWSLGGVYARLLANRAPEKIRQVITLGSPFNHHPRATNSWRLFNALAEQSVDDIDPDLMEQVRATPPVPTTLRSWQRVGQRRKRSITKCVNFEKSCSEHGVNGTS